MIDGLKVTVGGIELADIASARAAHHSTRKAFYDEKVTALQGVPSGSHVGSAQDPLRQMQEKAMEHGARADEMNFIAAHIKRSEDYLLDTQDLCRLGIVRQRRQFF